MQIRIQVALLAAVMIPGFAHAEQMIRKETIKPEALASMQAVVDYCSSVDARNREYFEGQEQVALRQVSEDSVEKARASAAYRTDYRADLAAFDQLPAGFGAAVCAGMVPAWFHGGHDN